MPRIGKSIKNDLVDTWDYRELRELVCVSQICVTMVLRQSSDKEKRLVYSLEVQVQDQGLNCLWSL